MGCGSGSRCVVLATAQLTYSTPPDTALTVPKGGGGGTSQKWYHFDTDDPTIFRTFDAGLTNINTAGNVFLDCMKTGVYLFAGAAAWPNATYVRSSVIQISVTETGGMSNVTQDTGALSTTLSANIAPPFANVTSWHHFYPSTGNINLKHFNYDPTNDRVIASAQLYAIYLGPTRASNVVYG